MTIIFLLGFILLKNAYDSKDSTPATKFNVEYFENNESNYSY